MAENAERTLQDMIPEMKEMEKIGIFVPDETRKIMKKRREFEYKLRRKTKEKKDFLQYIQYEKSVLDLVRIRRNKSKCMGMKKEIDVCILRRIHRMYEMACSRFPGSLDVWKEHIAFCIQRKERASVEKVFNQAMRLHPHNEDMWILWATHEMQDNMSPGNARQLLQRSLRTNPDSRRLYKEYFNMELLYAEKLRKRQEVLDVAELQSQSTILKGEVALVVYKNAVNKFPDDVEFCLSFVELCQPFEFSSWIVDYIYDDVEERFKTDELALAAIAKRPLSSKSGDEVQAKDLAAAMKKSCENFEDALKKVQTERMWELYVSFCIEMVKMSPSSSLANWAVDHLMKIFLRAVEDEKLTENIALNWVDMLSKTGQVLWGLEIIPLLTDKFQRSLALWLRQLEFLMLCDSDADAVMICMKEALKHLDKPCEHLTLWKLVIDWSLVSCPSRVKELLEDGLTCGKRDVCVALKEYYLSWAYQHLDIKAVRKLFKRLSSAPTSLNLFYTYINLELSQASPRMKKTRYAFECALLEFGSTDIDVWMRYLEMEMMHSLGNPANVRILYERAKKSLKDTLADRFIEQSIRYSMASGAV